jgi:uncharacterized protein (DUF1778 family)
MSAIRKSETVTFRMDTGTLDVIQRAARIQGKSLTSFVTDAAYALAQKELLDQRFLKLDAEMFDKVEALLSEPVRENEDVIRRFRALPKWAD